MTYKVNPRIATLIWEHVEKYVSPLADFILIGEDFKGLTPSENSYQFIETDDYFGGVVIGMPPKGTRTSTEIEYFNACAEFADTIIFVVPKTFRKISVQNRLSMNFVLEYEEELGHDAFIENGKAVDKPYIVQVWKQGFREPEHPITSDFSFVKDGGIIIRRVGNTAGEVVEKGEGSSFYHIQPHIDGIEDSLKSIDWSVVSENTVGISSISKSEIIWMYNKWKELYSS